MIMAQPVYRKAEDEVMAVKVQTQQVYEATKEAQSRLAQLKPVVTSTVDQQRVIAQQIVLETYKSLEKGIPKDYSLRTLLG